MKKVPVEKILLMTIAAVGILAVVAVAPGVGPALRVFGAGKRKYPQKYVNDAISRLKGKGYITFEERGGKRYLRLTSAGKERLEEYHRGEKALKKPKRWDGKWRLIAFDIKEKKRNVRDRLRRELTSLGFMRLQNSVWIYPYDCEEVITMLKADCKIGKDVLYVVADSVQYDRDLKQLFKL
jgi:DNA-binding transcriptional regulator PaaX|tara:strand:- start:55112 stop:55654 length:543 start_codon:yes stop_codon:yes gene_type:complete